MHPQLQAIEQDLAMARSRFSRLMAATSDVRWATRSSPDQWSVAECIAHLNLSSRAMQPLLEEAVREARALVAAPGAARRLRGTVLGSMLARLVGPAPGIGRLRFGRTTTPPSFVPAGELSRPVVVSEFEKHLEAHARLLAAADGLPIDQPRIASPFAQGVQYDAYSALRVVTRHMHRHLAQAERVWGSG